MQKSLLCNEKTEVHLHDEDRVAGGARAGSDLEVPRWPLGVRDGEEDGLALTCRGDSRLQSLGALCELPDGYMPQGLPWENQLLPANLWSCGEDRIRPPGTLVA